MGHTRNLLALSATHTQSPQSAGHTHNPLNLSATHTILSIYRPLPATPAILSFCRPHAYEILAVRSLYQPHKQSSHSMGHTRNLLTLSATHTQSPQSVGHTHNPLNLSPSTGHTRNPLILSATQVRNPRSPLALSATKAILSLDGSHTQSSHSIGHTHTIPSICRPHTQSSQSIALYRPHPQSSHSVGHTSTKSSQSARSISHISNPLTRWVTHEIFSLYRPHTLNPLNLRAQ